MNINFLSTLNWYILAPVLFIIFALVLRYFFHYSIPASRLQADLKKIASELSKFKKSSGLIFDTEMLRPIFLKEPFQHLWAEYEDTLHLLRSTDGTPISLRATSTSEIYFSKESVVDTQIDADFFRHLPGILTGIGIIGTFSGLV